MMTQPNGQPQHTQPGQPSGLAAIQGIFAAHGAPPAGVAQPQPPQFQPPVQQGGPQFAPNGQAPQYAQQQFPQAAQATQYTPPQGYAHPQTQVPFSPINPGDAPAPVQFAPQQAPVAAPLPPEPPAAKTRGRKPRGAAAAQAAPITDMQAEADLDQASAGLLDAIETLNNLGFTVNLTRAPR